MSIWDSAQGLWALTESAGNTSGWLDVSTTNNNDLTGANSPTARNGFGGATNTALGLTAVGTIAFLEITGAAQTGLDGGTSDFTVACWMRVDSFGAGSRTLVSKAGLGEKGYQLRYDGSSHTLGMLIASPLQSNAITLWDTQSLALDTWYHAGFTYINATKHATLYLDGVAVSTGTAGTSDIRSNNAGFTLGALDSSQLGNEHRGGLDDVGVWTRGLSTAEMLTLVQSTGENFGVAPPVNNPTATTTMGLDFQASGLVQKPAGALTTMQMSFQASGRIVKGATATTTMGLDFQAGGSAVLGGGGSTALSLNFSAVGAVLTGAPSIIEPLVGGALTLISETVSLGQGGSFTSSVYLSDRLRGISGYTQSKSSTSTLVIQHSINSAFTSAVTETVIINSLSIPQEFSFLSLPGRYVRYGINAVASASQVELNMYGIIN